MRIRGFAGVLIAATVACRSGTPATDVAVAQLLRSSDRLAVYNAGAKAYRAEAYPKARRLWRHAAELGDHEAASNLGFLLYYGLGGVTDSAEAAAYWRRAMAQGDAEAHRHVAQAILDGDLRLGQVEEAYGHALAAQRRASRPNELVGAQVARDAEQLANGPKGDLSEE
jgi:TPR repeat protein